MMHIAKKPDDCNIIVNGKNNAQILDPLVSQRSVEFGYYFEKFLTNFIDLVKKFTEVATPIPIYKLSGIFGWWESPKNAFFNKDV